MYIVLIIKSSRNVASNTMTTVCRGTHFPELWPTLVFFANLIAENGLLLIIHIFKIINDIDTFIHCWPMSSFFSKSFLNRSSMFPISKFIFLIYVYIYFLMNILKIRTYQRGKFLKQMHNLSSECQFSDQPHMPK